jgi:hypothetical protein
MRAKIAVAAITEICCPMTWKTSAPNRSIAGSLRTQTSGSKSGRSSITRASTGSAACSQASPVRISCARAVATPSSFAHPGSEREGWWPTGSPAR